ncbi:lipopolysaccharide assembly protein LapB [Halobacteriovorax sp. HLS]|uniref:tetratricopeptide repeat protein n=1 Tax=Halobacteriovorax sp. HLS TaxID=2234000 RepID=UPI000FD7EA2A|nr:tetratricopeptide repeat protein [Halobacteriovorax sp. HLS]
METFNANELLEKGKACYNGGEYKKAAAIFNELIEIDPKAIEALFYLANIFHINGEIGKAIKAFNKVISLDPTHTDAAISLSVLYNDIGHYEDAKKVFNQANERVKSRAHGSEGIDDQHVNKKFAIKHLELADLYMTYNRYDEALFEYNKVASLNPEDLEVRIKVAKVYAKKGFISKAIDELKTLKNESPNYINGRIALGVLQYGNGSILEAQAEWEKVLSLEPHNSEAAMYLNLSQTATETSL